MIVSFDDVWKFLETTHVHVDVLHIVSPHDGAKIPQNLYIKETYWEERFDIAVLRKLWEDCHTFIVHGSSITPELRSIIEEIEEDNNVEAQSHIYMGKIESRSFPIHADDPDNLIIQCIGKSRVTIYNEYRDSPGGECPEANLTVKEQVILEPGNTIYIPSLQFHLFEPLTDRLSISIPMIRK